MSVDTLLDGRGLEVWRGGVNTWECDEMGHMNVRFYVARAVEGLAGMAAGLGMPAAFRRDAGSTLLVKDQHIRFLREARPGAPLHMLAGVLEVGQSEARILQLLVHSVSGEVAASIQSLVAHVTARELRPFPWAKRTLERVQGLVVEVPSAAAPRSLDLAPGAGTASLREAERLGLMRICAGVIVPADCDVFGRSRADVFIGRVSDGVTALRAGLRDATQAPDPIRDRVGGAVLEYRIAHWSTPEAGDRFEIRSGLAAVTERTQRLVHWILDPETGRPWATAAAVAVALDLDARRIVPIPQADREVLERRVTPGLAF